MNDLILKSTEVNSTSIIPNFGAIMKMGKTFMYNEFLKYDDGKLAKFIASEKGIDEGVAKEEIAKWVTDLQSELDAGKTIVFNGVGELAKVDGKMKFTAKTVSTSSPVEIKPKKVDDKIEKPKVENKEEPIVKEETEKPVQRVVEPKVPGKKEEVSADFKAKEVVEKIQSYTDKTALIDFTRGDTRKTVVAALNTKLDELNGKKKKTEEKKEDTSSAEVKPPKNVITEVKTEPKVEDKKNEPVAPVIKEEQSPKKEEKQPDKNEEPKALKKEEEVKPVVVPTVEDKKVEPKKEETPQPTIKEKAATIEKPETSQEEEDAAIAAIVGGVEESKKETKKRKKKWILWVALLLILIGGGTVGYLQKDMIMSWFDKKHEPKDLAEGHDESGDEENVDNHSNDETNNDSHNGEEVVDTEGHEENDAVANEVTEPIETPVVEVEDTTPEVEEPVKEEKPVVTNSSSEGDWHIVAGSYSSESNAENKVEKLKSMGYSSAKVLGKYNGLYTVRVASYTSKEEAKVALESYKNTGNSGMIKKL